jgi:nucleobase:cation symporter-1, NCS1 family
MSFFTGFGVSAIVYYTLNYVFPVPGKYAKFAELDVSEDDVEERDSYSNEDAKGDEDKKDPIETEVV